MLNLNSRKLNSTVSMSVNAWTALDIMAEEDDTSVSRTLERLVSAEAKRRLDLKQPKVEEPVKRKGRVVSEAERERSRLRLKAVWAARRAVEQASVGV